MLHNGSSWLLQKCLTYLPTEFNGQFGLQVSKPERHHDVQLSAIQQEHQAVEKIKVAILSHGNPFTVEGNQLLESKLLLESR